MDADRFDTLSRSLATAGSRRRALSGLVSGTLGLALVASAIEDVAAKKCKKIKNKQKRKKCLAKARCVPSCAGKLCGDDGCGGLCGVICPSTHICQDGRCHCTARCAGKTCGDDGCGSACGSCAAPRTCQSGRCTCPEEECQGNCVPGCVQGALDPRDCTCCRMNGSLCDFAPNTVPCCSGDCQDFGGGIGSCVGKAPGDECDFDAQCRSGKCDIFALDGSGDRFCS